MGSPQPSLAEFPRFDWFAALTRQVETLSS